MDKTFDPKNFEARIYDAWEKEGYFAPDMQEGKKAFSIVMPPPNITGQLHIGHAMDCATQDAVVRFKRMQGYSTLWLPGTDHASIATEMKIVEGLKREGKTKEQVGREEFLRLARDWKEKYGGRIEEQLRKLGSSCDWSRKAFTMDENLSKAVRHVFKYLYDKGYIYRGNRITNVCINCGTALSDAEVEYETEMCPLWTFKYPLSDGSGFVRFATTRPETMLGDTALAVNPTDERFTHLVGKTVIVPFGNREIPIIADDYVEKDFGTGVVKITPAHDPNDFEVGKRHNLPVLKIMTEKGIINELGGEFQGLTRKECKQAVIDRMVELNLAIGAQPLTHNAGHCHRCHTLVEPMTSSQWFVRMSELAKPAIEAVKNGDVSFIPTHFEKTYFHWMENLKDWCISRQLWWGHRIPIFYCDKCGAQHCSEEDLTVCPDCGGALRQDEDVLDTWFSSALWPFSTMGYPRETPDLERFFPTDLLVTGYDIITFWVSRMIFSSLEYMGKVPFKKVLIHGLVRDENGRKMSKSLNNGVDPLDIIEHYGADNLRFTLLNGVAQGADTRFSLEKVTASGNFLNKLWNASRFVFMNGTDDLPPPQKAILSIPDKWILTRLNELISEVTANMEAYDLGLALSKLYEFTRSQFCDWYIELCKPALYGMDEDVRAAAQTTLMYVLDKLLKMLHPFIPFITEEIYLSMYCVEKTIMTQPYPTPNRALNFLFEERVIEQLKELVSKVRNQRAEHKVPPSKRIRIFIKPLQDCIENAKMYIEKLCNADVVFTKTPETENNILLVCNGAEAYIPLGDIVDIKKQVERLTADLELMQSEIERAESKLNNPGFLNKAPKKLIATEKTKLEEYKQKKERLSEAINEFSKLL